METQFQVIVSIERVENEGVGPTFEQMGEMIVLGKFDTLDAAQRYVATLPCKPE